MARPVLPRPTDAECQILLAILNEADRGKSEGLIVREIFEIVTKERGNGYNAILKLVQIMTSKELVIRDDSVRPQRYKSAMTRMEFEDLMLRDLRKRIFAGENWKMIVSGMRVAKVKREVAYQKTGEAIGRELICPVG